eukprot:TRINITY_DN111474_c0_g1_i1.p1 TRINITY_DN111474_c0_g1~~TRINITY_DN111474_c0_g1_i1.p1  ORF type:complete len:220 (-),score=34.38 TRINITY_DN111474_c0_g1_i1:94-678(-)
MPLAKTQTARRRSLAAAFLSAAVVAVLQSFLRGPAHNTFALQRQHAVALANRQLLCAPTNWRSLRRGVSCRFKVTLETPEGVQVIECPPEMIILDKAEEEGIEMPWSCRTGDCSVCTGKVLSGEIDQSDQKYLTDEQVADDLCLTCVTKPTSDCRIQTHCDYLASAGGVTQEEMDEALDLGMFGDDDDSDAVEL